MQTTKTTITFTAITDDRAEFTGEWTGDLEAAVRAGCRHLQAERVVHQNDGTPSTIWYRWRADETAETLLATEEQVAQLGAALLTDGARDEYSTWCAGNHFVVVPDEDEDGDSAYYTESTQEYIVVDEISYAVDTVMEIGVAQDAMRDAGVVSTPIYRGHPECPDSHRSGRLLWASDRDDHAPAVMQ